MSATADTSGHQWNLPNWTPRPVVPEDNPMSEAKVEVGEAVRSHNL
ncbi:MAG: hypothetical protein F6K04_04555 [Leptolyngbya sp. SIO4C5]|nr:hypothetical protein [Leptolyngbya sp. SIO4C5]